MLPFSPKVGPGVSGVQQYNNNNNTVVLLYCSTPQCALSKPTRPGTDAAALQQQHQPVNDGKACLVLTARAGVGAYRRRRVVH